MESISTGGFATPLFTSATGCWLIDREGARFFDGTAGSGAISLGHQAPEVLEAARAQIDRLVHTGCKIGSDVRHEMIEKLCRIAPFTEPAVLPAVIGAEAVEAALKVARAATGRRKVVSFTHAYHGKSAGALALTWREYFKTYSSLPASDVLVASFPDLDELDDEARVSARLADVEVLLDRAAREGSLPAAVILEPIQVTEGVLCPGVRFLDDLIALCRSRGVLVVFDEIYTGMGRCGSLFFCDQLREKPDLLILGKSLGNGFPISVVVGEAGIINALPASVQTSTYSGHPVSAAAASRVIDVVMESKLWEVAERVGASVLAGLEDMASRHAFVRRPRGHGMLLAFDCVGADGAPAPELTTRFAQAALDRRLILFKGGPVGNTVKIVPPVRMSDEEMAFLNVTLMAAADAVS